MNSLVIENNPSPMVIHVHNITHDTQTHTHTIPVDFHTHNNLEHVQYLKSVE